MSYTELWIMLKHNKEFLCITHTVEHINSLLLNQHNGDDTPKNPQTYNTDQQNTEMGIYIPIYFCFKALLSTTLNQPND